MSKRLSIMLNSPSPFQASKKLFPMTTNRIVSSTVNIFGRYLFLMMYLCQVINELAKYTGRYCLPFCSTHLFSTVLCE